MANKPKTASVNRRETIEAMRRQQRAAERRKTLTFVTIAVVLGLALIAAVVIPAVLKDRNDPAKKALASLGVATAAAGCSATITDPRTAAQVTADGSHTDAGKKVTYDMVPPSAGPHDANFVTNPPTFYSTKDVPAIERVVHSLEHGYTLMWYDSTIKDKELQTVRDIAKRADAEKVTTGRFIAVPLDETRGKLPDGKHIALTHWGSAGNDRTKAFREVCAAPSGAAVEAFIQAHPASAAPEPGGA